MKGMAANLNEGEEGITISVLRPMGSAEFNGKIFEVKPRANILPME
jgi:hypothetical protein